MTLEHTGLNCVGPLRSTINMGGWGLHPGSSAATGGKRHLQPSAGASAGAHASLCPVSEAGDSGGLEPTTRWHVLGGSKATHLDFQARGCRPPTPGGVHGLSDVQRPPCPFLWKHVGWPFCRTGPRSGAVQLEGAGGCNCRRTKRRPGGSQDSRVAVPHGGGLGRKVEVPGHWDRAKGELRGWENPGRLPGGGGLWGAGRTHRIWRSRDGVIRMRTPPGKDRALREP